MLKNIVRKVCQKIYELGYFESNRLNNESISKARQLIAKIHPTVWISDGALISNNSLPSNRLQIGANSRIMGDLYVFDHDGEIVIGEETFIGPFSKVWSAKKISIGSRVLISHNVNIHDSISHPLDAQLRYDENRHFVKTGVHKEVDIKASEIIIEDDVWIGFNCSIMRGVRIGKGAIIGANSVVTKDVEPWTVNVGNPLRCIRELDPH